MTGVDLALIGLAVAFGASIVRVAVGPSVADRAVAVDVCLYAAIAGIALLAIRQGSEAFLDVALIASLLGFVATVALARLVTRSRS